jgi:hypothetical protein
MALAFSAYLRGTPGIAYLGGLLRLPVFQLILSLVVSLIRNQCLDRLSLV